MFKPCILVPVYDHAGAIGSVVEQLRPFGLHCWLIDDGSNAHCQATLQEIAAPLPLFCSRRSRLSHEASRAAISFSVAWQWALLPSSISQQCRPNGRSCSTTLPMAPAWS